MVLEFVNLVTLDSLGDGDVAVVPYAEQKQGAIIWHPGS